MYQLLKVQTMIQLPVLSVLLAGSRHLLDLLPAYPCLSSDCRLCASTSHFPSVYVGDQSSPAGRGLSSWKAFNSTNLNFNNGRKILVIASTSNLVHVLVIN